MLFGSADEKRFVLGYDLGEKVSQISYLSSDADMPETWSTALNFIISLRFFARERTLISGSLARRRFATLRRGTAFRLITFSGQPGTVSL